MAQPQLRDRVRFFSLFFVLAAAAEERGVAGVASDTAIRAQIDALRLGRDLEIFVAVHLEVVAGSVYLMGIAKDEAGLRRVKARARVIPHVKRVIGHVILTDDSRRKAG